MPLKPLRWLPGDFLTCLLTVGGLGAGGWPTLGHSILICKAGWGQGPAPDSLPTSASLWFMVL